MGIACSVLVIVSIFYKIKFPMINEDIVLITVLILALPIFLLIMNNYPNLKLNENNIFVWYFFSYKKISWDKVIKIKNAPVHYNSEKALLIEFEELTLIHKLFGFLYNETTFKPIILVSAYTNKIDELIEEFKKRGKCSI